MQVAEKFTFLKVYADSISELAKGDEKLARELCRKIVQYGIYGNDEKSDSPVLEAMFISFKTMIDRGKEIALANSENGKKGGRPKKAKETETKAKQNPTESETKPNESKIENRKEKKEKEENNIILKNDTEAEASEYGNEEINKCLNLIKNYNGGLVDGTVKNNRRFAKLLIDKLNKLESIQSGKYTWNATLEIILKVISQNKYHAPKITSPELIYRNLAILMQACKNDIGKQQTQSIILPTV